MSTFSQTVTERVSPAAMVSGDTVPAPTKPGPKPSVSDRARGGGDRRRHRDDVHVELGRCCRPTGCCPPSARSAAACTPRASSRERGRPRRLPWRSAEPASIASLPRVAGFCAEVNDFAAAETSGKITTAAPRCGAAAPHRGLPRARRGLRPAERREQACSPESSPTWARSSGSRTAATCAPASAAPTPAAGIAIGASIACDGICLTVVDRGPAGGRRLVRRRHLGRDRRPHQRPPQPRRLGRGPPGQPRAGAAARRRARRPHRLGPRRRPRRDRGAPPRGRQRPLHLPRPRAARPLHRAQGVGRAQRHLAHGERGRRRDLRRQHHPAHPAPSPPGARPRRATSSNLEIDTLARYVARLADYAAA